MLMLLTSSRATLRQPVRTGDACLRRAVGTLLVAAGSSLVSLPVLAQTAPAPSEVAPSERAKRDADKVFHWIMIQADRTRKAPTKDPKDIKDTKDAKDERPVAKPTRVAAPEAVQARPKAEAVAAAEPISLKPAGKSAEKPSDMAAKTAVPAAVADASKSDAPRTVAPKADAPKADDARLARIDPASRGAAAPALELSDDAPQGLVALAQPAPQFPLNVMRALRRGTVQVQFNVLTDGSVANLEVLKTTNARINAAALEAIGQWRFQPVSKVQIGAVEVGFNLE
jgi:TonB family protein